MPAGCCSARFPLKRASFDRAFEDAVDLLARCDRIVTMSAAGASAIRSIASDVGLPILPIEIVPPVAFEAAQDDVDADERTVLALVDPCSSISGDRICSIFEQSMRQTENGTSWRLVLVVPFSPYPRLNPCSSRHEVLLHATAQQVGDRISRARVVINALSPAYEVESLRYTDFTLQRAASIIVRSGSGAETVCEDVGCGWRFRDEASLAMSLRHAVANRRGSDASRPPQCAGPTFLEAWTTLLGYAPPAHLRRPSRENAARAFGRTRGLHRLRHASFGNLGYGAAPIDRRLRAASHYDGARPR